MEPAANLAPTQIAPIEAWMRLLVDESPDLYLLVSNDGRILYASAAAVSFLHCEPDEAVGRSLLDYCHIGEEVILERLLAAAASPELGASNGRLRFSGVKKVNEFMIEFDNMPRSYDVSARDASGLAAGAILMFFHDVSEQVMLDATWARLYTLDALGRLAGGFSHDFNNLLQVINCYADMIVTSPDVSEPDRESAEEIAEAGRRCAQLTSQLLAFSRRQTSQPVPLDANEVITSISTELEQLSTSNDIEFSVRLSEEPCSLNFDREQLLLILRTVVKNSVDAQPDGGRIEIATAIVEHLIMPNLIVTDDIPHIAIRIRDEGIGMDDGILTRLFEPFFTTKEQGKGVGLGLATIHGIIKQNKGYVGVDTDVGRGTTFVVYLPLARDLSQVPVPVAPAVAPVVESGRRVLLIEDEDTVLSLVTRLLNHDGYQVESAPDLSAAKALFAPGRFDLLITDVSLPDGNGLDFAEHIREQDPDLAVLLISGHPIDAMNNTDFDQHMSFLQKPFTRLSLLSAAGALITASRQLASSTADSAANS